MERNSEIKLQIEGDVAYITLNRPEKKNAMNRPMLESLLGRFQELEARKELRIICLQATGGFFCAGADIQWMAQSVHLSDEENYEEGMLLAKLFEAIFQSTKIVISIVQGGCYGGALGLVAASDFVLAEKDTRFSFGEVRLGLVPATIAPYIMNRTGAIKAKQLMLTGEVFQAEYARQIGLVDEALAADQLHDKLKTLQERLRFGGFEAQKGIKNLVHRIMQAEVSDRKAYTARIIAESRRSDEGREGLQAFIERRKPKWS